MDEERQIEGVQPPRRTYVHIVGAIVLAAILASMFVWGPWGGVMYMAGRFNSVGIYAISPLVLFFLLTPLVVICLLVLVVYTLSRWRRLSHRQRWRYVLLTAPCAAYVVSFGLEFTTYMMPSPFMMYVRGFVAYAWNTTDVPAIQAWLATLDPNDCQEQPLDATIAPSTYQKDPPKRIPWPPCLACFRSEYIHSILHKDDAGRPMIRLYWGSGMIGSWGIEVGNKDMDIPKTQEPRWTEYQNRGRMERFHEPGEYRRPLAPGAYVWATLE